MAQNETISLALEAQPVPEDRECVRNGSDIVKLVQDYVQVIGDGSTQPGQIFPSAVVIAEKALANSEEALEQVAVLEERVPQKRSSGQPVAIPTTGDSNFALSWSPEMPSTNYEVRVTYIGTATSSGDNFGFRVIDGSQSVSGCLLRLLNGNANTTKIIWVVEELLQ